MKYQQSHPWITFHINLEKMSHDLWIKLGQVHASRSGGDVILFIDYAVQGILDGLKEQIDVIRGEQLRITWRNFICDQFKDKSVSVNDRKKN